MKPRKKLAEKICDWIDENFGNFTFGSGYWNWETLDVNLPKPQEVKEA